MDIELVKNKFIEKIQQTGWNNVISQEILSETFSTALQKLEKEYNNGEKPFTPKLKNILGCFEETPAKDLKVVIIGQDPYSQLGVANGVAFDCRNTGRLQPSLEAIYDTISSSVYSVVGACEKNPSIERWSKQGVLLLNSSLTTRVGISGTHSYIWKDFVGSLISKISLEFNNIIFIFMGSKAKEYEGLIDLQKHYKFLLNHPAHSAYQGIPYFTGGTFVKVNDILKRLGKEEIIW